MALADIRQGYKDVTWFNANTTLVLKEGQRVNLLQTGLYKLGDGTTTLIALSFLGTGSQTLAQTLANGNNSNNLSVVSQNGKNIIYTNDTRVGVEFYDDVVGGSMTSEATGNIIYHDVKNIFQSPINNFPQENADEIAYFDASHNLKGTGISPNDIQLIGGVLKLTVKLSLPINKGQVVYISSANGTNIIVSKADNTTEATSSKTIGLIETTGTTNDIVNVITEGLLTGLNTSTATIGDPVWLGTSGNLIFGLTNKPVAPAHLVYIGVVSRVHAVNGEVLIRVQNGFELNEIHDVNPALEVTTTLDADAFLIKDSLTNIWKSLTWSNLKVNLNLLPTEKKVANHIITNADRDKIIAMDLAVVNTITIRLNSVNPVDIGAQILIQQFNDGQITFVAESGVIINSKNGSLKSNGKFSFQSLIKIDVDEYDLTGDLEFDNSIEIINNIASYTLVLSDANKLIRQNVAVANNVTIPLDSTVSFPIGTQILVDQAGIGQVTIVATGGVTLKYTDTLKTRVQNSALSLIKTGVNEWDVSGDTEPLVPAIVQADLDALLITANRNALLYASSF